MKDFHLPMRSRSAFSKIGVVPTRQSSRARNIFETLQPCGGGGGKTESICHFAFSLGGRKVARCREKQHEKCHCHTPFCAPPKDSKNKDLRAVSPYASKQRTGK